MVEQLVELQRSAAEYARRDGRVAADDLFFAEQNARVVANAERYYRAMFDDRASSWNLRDRTWPRRSMPFELPAAASEVPAKVVVWAHNSHLGDARATEMARRGELNVGTARARAPFGRTPSCRLQHVQRQRDRGVELGRARAAHARAAALPGSVEALFHAGRRPRTS